MAEYKCGKDGCQILLQQVGKFYICEEHGQRELLIIPPFTKFKPERISKLSSGNMKSSSPKNIPNETNFSELIYDEKDITNDLEKVELYKGIISKWSNEIPNNFLKNFGKKIQIISVIEKPAYKILLETQHEYRSIEEECVHYLGQTLPKQEIFKKEQIDIWNYTPAKNYFKKKFLIGKSKFKIENSQSIHICSKCNGSLEIECTHCDGYGDNKCGNCDGRKKTICYHPSHSIATGENCRHCDNGWIPCGECNINGRVTCSYCKGDKKEKCFKCNASGKVLNYFSISDNYFQSKNNTIISKSNIPERLNTYLSKETGTLLFEIKENQIDLSKLEKFKFEKINKTIQGLYNLPLILPEEINNNNGENKFIQQILSIEKINNIEILYNFEGINYYLWIYGSSNNIFAMYNIIDIFENKIINILPDIRNSRTITFSPDGKHIAASSWYNIIKIWDINTGKEVKSLTGYFGCYFIYSPDGSYIASITDDKKTIQIWDVNTGKEVKSLTGHFGCDFVYSPDGKYIAASIVNNIIKIWEIKTGKEVKSLTGHSASIFAYSPDGKYIAISLDKTIQIWDINTGKELKYLTSGFISDGINRIVYSPDGKYIAASSRDAKIQIWDVNTGNEVKSLTIGPSFCFINRIVYSPDGKYIACRIDTAIKIWDVNTGKEVKSLTGHFGCDFVYSPDGKYIAASNDMHITIRNGKYISSNNNAKIIQILDINTGKEVKFPTGYFDSCLFKLILCSPDGKYFIGILEREIKIYKLDYLISNSDPITNLLDNKNKLENYFRENRDDLILKEINKFVEKKDKLIYEGLEEYLLPIVSRTEKAIKQKEEEIKQKEKETIEEKIGNLILINYFFSIPSVILALNFLREQFPFLETIFIKLIYAGFFSFLLANIIVLSVNFFIIVLCYAILRSIFVMLKKPFSGFFDFMYVLFSILSTLSIYSGIVYTLKIVLKL